MENRFFWRRQDGQVLLIVVLIMVVALTVGLSLASRSVTNVRNAVEEANSQKAFSAAESGIERALKFDKEFSNQQLDNNTTISQVTIDKNYGKSIFLINNGNPVPKDDGVDVWLSTYPDYSAPQFTGGNLQIYWGTKSGCVTPDAAIEVILISGTRALPNMTKFGIDPCASGRGNNFTGPSAGATVAGHKFQYATSVPVTNGLLARITPLYSDTPIAIVGVDSSGNPMLLPSQGKLITAVGQSGTTQRKVSYFQGYSELPSEFFYSIFVPQ